MKLGNSVILTLSVADVEKSASFYEKLGFTRLAENERGAIMADGQIRLSLQVGEFPSPVITFFTLDLTGKIKLLKESGVEFAPAEKQVGKVSEAGFVDIDGQPIMLVELDKDDLLPPYEKAKCGIFGEFSIPVKDMKASVEFYARLGFERVGGDDENPYPWAAVKDGLMIIGLHQSSEFGSPMITYFASDMADRIEALKKEGLELINEHPDEEGRIVYAAAPSPDGQLISLYFAEGFEDGTNE